MDEGNGLSNAQPAKTDATNDVVKHAVEIMRKQGYHIKWEHTGGDVYCATVYVVAGEDPSVELTVYVANHNGDPGGVEFTAHDSAGRELLEGEFACDATDPEDVARTLVANLAMRRSTRIEALEEAVNILKRKGYELDWDFPGYAAIYPRKGDEKLLVAVSCGDGEPEIYVDVKDDGAQLLSVALPCPSPYDAKVVAEALVSSFGAGLRRITHDSAEQKCGCCGSIPCEEEWGGYYRKPVSWPSTGEFAHHFVGLCKGCAEHHEVSPVEHPEDPTVHVRMMCRCGAHVDVTGQHCLRRKPATG